MLNPRFSRCTIEQGWWQHGETCVGEATRLFLNLWSPLEEHQLWRQINCEGGPPPPGGPVLARGGHHRVHEPPPHPPRAGRAARCAGPPSPPNAGCVAGRHRAVQRWGLQYGPRGPQGIPPPRARPLSFLLALNVPPTQARNGHICSIINQLNFCSFKMHFWVDGPQKKCPPPLCTPVLTHLFDGHLLGAAYSLCGLKRNILKILKFWKCLKPDLVRHCSFLHASAWTRPLK